ncbi:glycosyltransferase family 4 protein [Phenylobacterium sp.]|uniref:glycosyltransferase family 4 protein n=1 Tax=Phenylobacterium sp. TaxID=1871053 RepID=UPI003567ED47
MNAAILFEPDGYLLTGSRLMGRQSAGNGFLRAAVQARGDQPVTAYTPSRKSADVFRRTVAEIDPTAESRWIPAQRLDLLAEVGLLYRPDHVMGPTARQRLRAGPAAYSICGVTHTLAGPSLESVAALLVEPLMAWDALICTSTAALGVVTAVMDRQAEYLRWRTGLAVPDNRPLLPVIPLGVHCDDFAFREDERRAAREELDLGAEAIAVLCAGRLSINGKANPYAMLRALQQTATETGRTIVLVFAGQAFNAAIAQVFQSATATYCPAVRVVFVDGKDAAAYRRAWVAADLFISLADSIQETFGITPVEAMAARLPALVSDWNGYRDTVRDGVDGFRIGTWAPEPGSGAAIARDHEVGHNSFPEYLSRSNTAVAVDMGELTARLGDLVTDPALRRRMGAAGRARARSTFDWPVVFRSYQALWDEQTQIRRKSGADPAIAGWLARAPRTGADHAGPFDTFAGYPTHHVGAATLVSPTPGMTPELYRARIGEQLLSLWAVNPEIVDSLLAALENGPSTVEALAAAAMMSTRQMAEVAARLAKIDVVTLAPGIAE